MDCREKCEIIAGAIADKKGFDIVTIDVSDRASVCDVFLIASANNANQVHAVAEKIDEEMDKAGEPMLRMEGARGAKWIAMDYSDVIVHIFEKETRQDYNIEMLWNSGLNMRKLDE